MINSINSEQRKHIITIEDPVEFRHKNTKSIITHREVGKDSDVAEFSDGIRSSLREDPDIILIGEMRDQETALAAIQAAQTGHLVFATLHTNSAAETISRLIDLFPPQKSDTIRVSLAQSLRLIISQKLPKSMTGSRILAYELMYNMKEIQNLIIKEKENFASQINSKMDNNIKEGMTTLSRSLIRMVREGKLSKKEAFEFSNDKDGFSKIAGDL